MTGLFKCALLLTSLALLGASGCEQKPAGPAPSAAETEAVKTPANNNTPQPGAAPRETADEAPQSGPQLLIEREGWDTTTALMKLLGDDTRLSAAVRLVRLSGIKPACMPDPLPDNLVAKLAVVPLSDMYFALGYPAEGSEARLRCPVLIEMNGTVTEPAQGPEAETAVLHTATAAGFPPVIITPNQLILIGETTQAAAVGLNFAPLRFELREKNGVRYVGLMLPLEDARKQQPDASEPVEVAQYRWDPYERLFVGPIADNYPEPYEGRFEMDLELSEALLPRGGDFDVEPLENKPPPGPPGVDPNNPAAPPF